MGDSLYQQGYHRLTGLSNELISGKSMHDLAPKGFPISNMMMEVFSTRQPLTEVIRYPNSTGRYWSPSRPVIVMTGSLWAL